MRGVQNISFDAVIPMSMTEKQIGQGRCAKGETYADAGLGKHVKIDIDEFTAGIVDYASFLEGGLRSHFLLVSEKKPVAEFSLREDNEQIAVTKNFKKVGDTALASAVGNSFSDHLERKEPLLVSISGNEAGVFRPFNYK